MVQALREAPWFMTLELLPAFDIYIHDGSK